jgi:hypothetical protein
MNAASFEAGKEPVSGRGSGDDRNFVAQAHACSLRFLQAGPLSYAFGGSVLEYALEQETGKPIWSGRIRVVPETASSLSQDTA